MRKPVQLGSVLIVIILCSWMMDATILDVGNGFDPTDPRNSAGPHDAYAYNVSGYSLYREAVWNRSFSEMESPFSSVPMVNTDKVEKKEDFVSRKSEITTLFLLAYGIVGIVGFWRQVMR
jgi:hypothetical protein